ncbi:helix-turn-helix transcriptional regulator [Streptomyces anulatus]|uniref:helix-turn-helix transcriptional regulator n=2 Tax=Streptomyces anulatus TaxID=1892 RepID=UPI00368CEF37
MLSLVPALRARPDPPRPTGCVDRRPIGSRPMAGHHAARSHDHSRALARRVRALRESHGWTREQLAKEADVSERTLARLEGEGAIQPGFFTVGAIAEALAVSLDERALNDARSPARVVTWRVERLSTRPVPSDRARVARMRTAARRQATSVSPAAVAPASQPQPPQARRR